MSPMPVRDNLDPYAAVSLSPDRLGNDGDEADENASAPPYPHRQRTVDRFGSVGDSAHSGTASTVQRPKVANLGDAHPTPGTLLREHRHDGYRKGTVTRPAGQGQGADSGARMAGMGTRDSTAQKRDDVGPFAEKPDTAGDRGRR